MAVAIFDVSRTSWGRPKRAMKVVLSIAIEVLVMWYEPKIRKPYQKALERNLGLVIMELAD